MQQISVEMPTVTNCEVKNCGYNVQHACHAKAITIGDQAGPGCDTFMKANSIVQETHRIAGVGACKIAGCRFNEDFECIADNISVGFNRGVVNCLTYGPRRSN